MRKLLTTTAIALAACWILAAGLAADVTQAAAIHACVKPRSGTTRIVGAKAKCRHGERKFSWSTEGPRGPAGVNGSNGAAGAPGSPGASGAGPLFAAGSSTQTHIPTTEIILVSKVVPPGSYMIWGKIDILEGNNKQESPLLACRLRAHAGTEESDEPEGIDESISETPLVEHAPGSFASALTIPLGGTYVSSRTSTLLVTCEKESGALTTATSELAQIQALGVTSIA